MVPGKKTSHPFCYSLFLQKPTQDISLLRIFQLNHIVLHSYQSVQCVCVCVCVHACMRACVCTCVCTCVCIFCIIMLEHLLIYIYIYIWITFSISVYIMCVCLFSFTNFHYYYYYSLRSSLAGRFTQTLNDQGRKDPGSGTHFCCVSSYS